MTDTTAKIRAKGLDATGVTEDIALQMYGNKGRHYMAIVELKVDETHEKSDGTRKVDLVVTQLEPAASDHMAEYLRELTRVCYFNRQNNGDQPLLMGADEPTMEGVLAEGAKFRPHPFVPVSAGENDQPICDVCGLLETAPQHSEQQMITADDEDDDEPEADTQEEIDEADAYHAEIPDLPDEAYPNDATDLEPADDDGPRERHLAPVADPFTPQAS